MRNKVTIKTLLKYLAFYGGKIVSTASLEPHWIDQARASDRLFVDKDSLGYVWEPDIKDFPQTEKELAEFEKWYPLDTPLPDQLKTMEWLSDILKRKS